MHVVVNAAMSADGKLASRRREQLRISGDTDFARVDRLRAESDAIMVGVGTVLADDPSLTRFDRGYRDAHTGVPARVVADSAGRVPTDAALFSDDAPTYVLTSEAAPTDRLETLRAAGATVVAAGEERVDLTGALAELEHADIEALMVEGGGELIFSLFERGLVDELFVYVGALVIGGRASPTLADGEGFVDDFPELTLSDIERLDDGVLLRWEVE
jgi:2,5-diamino-6-(ribosylamino)-4(3H)-pyrimidinone 5'-phosphate reductase